MNKFAVAHVTESALLVPVEIDLEFRSVGFCARRKTGEPVKKPLEKGNKFNLLMTLGLGLKSVLQGGR